MPPYGGYGIVGSFALRRSHESIVALLVEIIRASDGAHLRARYLEDLPDDREPLATIAAAVADQLR